MVTGNDSLAQPLGFPELLGDPLPVGDCFMPPSEPRRPYSDPDANLPEELGANPLDRYDAAADAHAEAPAESAHSTQIELFETMGNIYQPCRTIAVAMNGSKLEPCQASEVAKSLEQQLGLPVVDVVRDGPDRMLDVCESFCDAFSRSAGRLAGSN